MMREGIIINTKRRIPGQTVGSVPQVPSEDERYAEWVAKMTARGLSPRGNGFAWVWKGKKPPKTFLSKKPRIRKKRRFETVPV